MRLTLKNKIRISMDGLLKDNEKVGGTPDKFLLSRKEFGQLLVELHHVGRATEDVKVSMVKSVEDSVSLKIYRHKLNMETISELVDLWIKEEYTIKYKGIPIRLDSNTDI